MDMRRKVWVLSVLGGLDLEFPVHRLCLSVEYQPKADPSSNYLRLGEGCLVQGFGSRL